jgi:hypothetical protein
VRPVRIAQALPRRADFRCVGKAAILWAYVMAVVDWDDPELGVEE